MLGRVKISEINNGLESDIVLFVCSGFTFLLKGIAFAMSLRRKG